MEDTLAPRRIAAADPACPPWRNTPSWQTTTPPPADRRPPAAMPGAGRREAQLRLLLLEPSQEAGERVCRALRDGGYAVRATSAADLDGAIAALAAQTFDLLLCALDAERLPLARVVAALRDSAQGIPLLGVAQTEADQLREQVLAAGAADLVLREQLPHLLMVVRRELEYLAARRRLCSTEQALRETQDRCQALLACSREPIAYVHDGMHIYANAAYLERFGVTDSETIESLPLLDMVDSADRLRAKAFLRSFQHGKARQAELELTMTAPERPPMRVRMCATFAHVDGEPCTQVVLREAPVPLTAEQRLPPPQTEPPLLARADYIRQLQQAASHAPVGGRALLFIHLDRYEEWRSSADRGLAEGAAAAIGAAIAETVPDGGMAARIADEAFAVLAPAGDLQQSITLAEALRGRIGQLSLGDAGQPSRTTCSIGISLLGGTDGARGTLLNAQDAAAQARAAGGNQIQLFTTDACDDRPRDLHLKLSGALEGDDFALVYQPIASLRGAPGQRYEARLRLRSGAGILTPKDFIGAANRCGLLPAMDRWSPARPSRCCPGTGCRIRCCSSSCPPRAWPTIPASLSS